MDVIYMENTECFEIINRLSVRIAIVNGNELKGSGILFLRHAGEMAVVFTAAHVIADIFRENESKVCLSLGCTDSLGNPQEIDVEAKLVKNISDFVPDEGIAYIHPEYTVSESNPISDIAMILVPWQKWMNTQNYMQIAQGTFEEEVYGYGFPESMDKECEKQCSSFLAGKRKLQGKINNAVNNQTYSIEYNFNSTERAVSRSCSMRGFSGTGLFSFKNNSINLICVISGECGDRSAGTLLWATSSEKCRELLELANLNIEYPPSYERYKEIVISAFPRVRRNAKRLFIDAYEELVDDYHLLPENSVEKWYEELACKSNRKSCDDFWIGKLKLMVILYGSGFISGDNVTKPVINMPTPYEDDKVEIEYICAEEEAESILGRFIETEYFAKQGKVKNGTIFVFNSKNKALFLYKRKDCREVIRDITESKNYSTRMIQRKLGQFLFDDENESDDFDIIDGVPVQCNLAAIEIESLAATMDENGLNKELLQDKVEGVLRQLWAV